MNKNYAHIFLALILSALLLLLTDPFMVWMPPMYATTTLLVAAIFLGIWTGFIMREQARDEREVVHKMHSGRIAYLSGLVVLTAGMIVQGFSTHHVDPWIAGAIWVMVVSKLVTSLYFEKYK